MNTKGFDKHELEQHFLRKKYSEQTKRIIIDLFHNQKQPAAIAREYDITPQRVNNIKTMFLNDYKYEHSIFFEGQISIQNIDDLKEFAKLCKYLKITSSNYPARKIYI